MTQSEKRMFLIRELLAENPGYASVPVPEDSENQKLLLRGLMNIRPPKNIHAEFLKVQDAYLKEETEKKGITDVKDLTPVQEGLYLWQGDITTLRCHRQCGQQRNDRLLYSQSPLH